MNWDKIDEVLLALLYLGRHENPATPLGARAWKTFDWEAMDRLHSQGLITNPATKAKSVQFTQDELREAEAAFHRLFDNENEADTTG